MRPGADRHADGRDVHHGGYRAIMRWITTTNFKDVGMRHLDFSRTMFFVGIASIAGEILFSQPGSPLWS
jgi:hypothetical protein